MKNNVKKLRAVAALAAFVVAALPALLAGCAGGEAGDGKLKVAADIAPLADFCRQVGGDLVVVETMVPPGASPHTYELTSGQMRFLSEADVLVTNGLGLTPWAEEVLGKTDNPGLVAVVAGEAVPQEDLIPVVAAAGGEDGHEEHGAYNPHVWLDPHLARHLVEAVRDGLVRADPGDAAVYRANAEEYLAELASLDRAIAAEVASFESRKFVSFHSSWTYFARRYGLEQAGVIEELPGKEPSAGEIAELVEVVRGMGVRVIFAEPQFSPRTAETIAEESGGEVVVRVLDPLGDPGNPETDTYLEMMGHDLEVMGEVLR